MAEEPMPGTTYTCVVGHAIPADELDALTEVQSLDGGALVRVCREHAAPIAVTILPAGRQPDGRQLP